MKKVKYILLFIPILLIAFPNFSIATVSQNSLKSVVRIICTTEEGTWSGSGMIITNDGYVLTNKHVISGDSGNIYSGCSIGITNDEFSEPVFSYTAKTIIAASGADLALLKINSTRTDFSYSNVFLYNLPSQSTEIEALGYPLMGGSKITYTKGYVSGVAGSQEDLGNFFIKADLKIDAGNSGGPSFTNKGEFMGINSAVLAGEFNVLGLIIPSTTIFDFLRANSYDYLISGIQKKDNNQSYQFSDYSGSTNQKVIRKFPDGTLIQPEFLHYTAVGKNTIYLLENGKKRPFTSRAAFEYSGYRFNQGEEGGWESNITLVTEEEFYQYPLGEPISIDMDEVIKEGALIRSTWWEDCYDVYIVKYVGNKKFKRLILSPSVFNNYGHLKWEDIRDEDETIVYSFTTSDLVRVVGGEKVYQLFPQGDTGIKRWVNLSASEFLARGYDPDSIYEVNQFDLDSYITGEPIQ